MSKTQRWRLAAGFWALGIVTATASVAMGGEGFNPGLNVGDKIPTLSLVDQDGKKRTYKNLRGKQGTLFIFHRSADW